VVRRAYSSVQEIAGLSDREIANLGLDPDEVARLKSMLDAGATPAFPTSVVMMSAQRVRPKDK
jgi:hypothetical protein